MQGKIRVGYNYIDTPDKCCVRREYCMFFFLFISILITGAMLWFASLLTDVKIDFKQTSIAAGASSLTSAVPVFGWPLSFIVLFYLLRYFSKADIWPDIILVVLTSKILTILFGMIMIQIFY